MKEVPVALQPSKNEKKNYIKKWTERNEDGIIKRGKKAARKDINFLQDYFDKDTSVKYDIE